MHPLDQGNCLQNAVNAVGRGQGLHRADDKAAIARGPGALFGAKQRRVDAKGRDRKGLVRVQDRLSGHGPAGGEEMVGLAQTKF